MLDISFLKTNIFSINNVDAKKVLNSIEEDKDINQDEPRKRRRLDDFTPQERMVRRKLKNRVAAQNARDRKKERMDNLELIVSRLENENKERKRSNEELRTNMHFLMTQNKELRNKLGMEETPEREGDHSYDHSYASKKLKMETLNTVQVSSPVVPDHDHIVIKQEEGSEIKHAEEITDTSSFVNHHVISQSQTDQLLELLKTIGAGTILEVDSPQKVALQTTTEIDKSSQVCGSTTSEEPAPDISSLSEEEANELFSICKDITNMVGGPNDSLNTKDLISITQTNKFDISSITKKLLKDIPGEILGTSSEFQDSFDMSAGMLLDDDTTNCSSSSDEFPDTLGFTMDENFSFNSKVNGEWEDVFTELFPTLAPV